MFKVLLVDEVNGNCYKRFECEDLFACEVFVDHKKYDAPKDCHYEIASDLADDLDEEINSLYVEAEMIPEEELKDEVSSMISKILEAYDNKQITESEKDKLINMLQQEGKKMTISETAKQICNLSLAGYINGEEIHAQMKETRVLLRRMDGQK